MEYPFINFYNFRNSGLIGSSQQCLVSCRVFSFCSFLKFCKIRIFRCGYVVTLEECVFLIFRNFHIFCKYRPGFRPSHVDHPSGSLAP